MSINIKRGASYRKYGAWIAILAFLAPPGASAAALGCVQRVIDWNAASWRNYTVFAMVALHGSGEGAYGSGTLVNSTCDRKPYALGTVSCLLSQLPVTAQLLHPTSPPTTPGSVLSLLIHNIPSDNLAQVHFSQQNATYDFDPVCAGNFLVGNDQWGNRWTVSFILKTNTSPN